MPFSGCSALHGVNLNLNKNKKKQKKTGKTGKARKNRHQNVTEKNIRSDQYFHEIKYTFYYLDIKFFCVVILKTSVREASNSQL